jgi:uncharacterized protein
MATTAAVHFERKPVFTLEMPFGQQMQIINHRFEPRWRSAVAEVTILTGLHGDELDGGLVCHLLSQFLQRLGNHWKLNGIVNILPNVNPLSGNLGQRFVPMMGSDLNRNFPGNDIGFESERLAAAIFEVTSQSLLCIDIHSSNNFLEELPQTRIVNEPAVVDWAATLGLDVIWTHSAHNWISGTIAQALYERNINALVIEVGTGSRLNRPYCERVFRGIVQCLQSLGVLSSGTPIPTAGSLRATETNVTYINAEAGGLFVPATGLKLGDHLRRGMRLGQIIDPLFGQEADVLVTSSGVLFTLRANPVVYAGSLVARVLQT